MGCDMEPHDQEHVILSEIEQEGYDDALQYADISDNPYARGTKEFDAWRAGWCDGEDAWYHKAASE